MPHIDVKTVTGTVSFHYTISTPVCESAQAIDPALPTIIFLHPVYLAQVIYYYQFADTSLRRFNLVALDLRCHGETKGSAGNDYGRVQAAEDVFLFMEALGLPPCHVFGLSMGSSVALQLAISHPGKVLSLCMLSPSPAPEPEEVAEGRQEIYDCWVAGFNDPENVDDSALLDAVYGSIQLGFNGNNNSIVQALNNHTVPQAMKNWSPEHFDDFHAVTVKFFTNSQPYTALDFQKITCPVILIHGKGDIAYPVEYSEELLQQLQLAGVDTEITLVDDAPHFSCVTHPTEVNLLLHNFVLKNTKATLPSPPTEVTSPFEAWLTKTGWSVDSDSEDDTYF
ncbi:alpha/beta-hydrolase [Cyathus striatus]|nr:alpha/beta-hydrolase [Cyathus striatus]